MILLLESHARARDLLSSELADYGEVCAPPLDGATSLGDLISGVLSEGRCKLLVLGDQVPGASPASLIRLLRAYLPQLPVVVMRRDGEMFPPIPRVVAVPYTEFESQLVPTVYFLLQEQSEESEHARGRPAKTLPFSPILARLTARVSPPVPA